MGYGRVTVQLVGYRLPSDNKYRRMHAAVRKKTRGGLASLLRVSALKELGAFSKPFRKKVHVTLRIVHPPGSMRYDEDNCWKVLLDAAKDAGLIWNDSHLWVSKDDPIQEIGLSALTEVTFEVLDSEPKCHFCRKKCRHVEGHGHEYCHKCAVGLLRAVEASGDVTITPPKRRRPAASGA